MWLSSVPASSVCPRAMSFAARATASRWSAPTYPAAGRVVRCAGPDTYRLLALGEPERLRSVRLSFALREPIDGAAPCWIQRDPQLSEAFYAVMDGPDHYSIGLSEAGSATVPEAEHVRRAHGRIVEIVSRLLPGLVPIAERVIACEF